MEAQDCGKNYWCVKTDLSDDGEVHLYADSALITDTGDVVFRNGDGLALISFAEGNWSAFYAASTEDGSPLAVEHWAGEVEED